MYPGWRIWFTLGIRFGVCEGGEAGSRFERRGFVDNLHGKDGSWDSSGEFVDLRRSRERWKRFGKWLWLLVSRSF